ncbi:MULTISPECIES: CPBP family intramembrane glutamic endopeptidase [Staphylococcus]|uniref:CPBP family intramembrane metalloprotease n=4 Tax=Staphylococcus pettenkoferi TaxID=170573 RepID=A0A2N6QFR8_9STAP|nr:MULTISPECIES: type II CAAX endopeptidase family protein [Staphylococcus]MBX8993882.1 CPBP family intramembrane metalloprotease [Staphylococcus pettenkoferi]MCI2792188.1 CPBP family intramembrane metalloprotease [Staphylococcus pettenkoferi]MCY1604647.1 CPBP family intramembrane metalloprotease [Staphylococcus pettenkoferi]OFK77218.1 hypothetical protein HMPREF2802_08870 [Staphylococcus sp. HMSC071G07]PMC18424.1 CPBP family intramembrane metalloprotease [Staphylococcus pettenkoferi]
MSSEMNEIKYPERWHSRYFAWRDLWLVPLYFLLVQIVLAPIISLIMILVMDGTMYPGETSTYKIILNFANVLVTLLIFYLMHVNHDIVRIAIERFKQVKKQLIFIIIVFVLAQLVSQLYNWLLNFLPSSLQFDDTANNKEVLKLFDVNWLIPVSLIMGVILIPLVEELIFRHLIIHELGKKITYPIAAILSIILFTGLHLLGMKSPFEIGEYLIIAVPIVIVYMRSGRNLAASFTYHALNNGFAFLLMLLM